MVVWGGFFEDEDDGAVLVVLVKNLRGAEGALAGGYADVGVGVDLHAGSQVMGRA